MSAILWLVPKPTSVAFEDLKHVDTNFSTAIGKSGLDHSLIIHEAEALILSPTLGTQNS